MFVFERQQNDIVLRRPIINEAIMDHVPAAVYSITMTNEGVKLKYLRKQFTIPEKIYGKHGKYKNTILESFKSEKGSTGALLVGNKGCGKSLLAEDISNSLIAQGYPILYIESPLPAELLADVIRGIGPCGVVFEEFGKVYEVRSENRPDQLDLLTLFSDSSLQKVLFIILENSVRQISDFLLNRPKRIHFKIDYTLDYYEEFQEIWGDVPLSKEIDQFVTVYLRSLSHQRFEGGWDVLFALAKILKEEKSLKDILDRISYTNIPRAFTCGVKVTGEYLKKGPSTGEVFLQIPGQNCEMLCLEDLALKALKTGIYSQVGISMFPSFLVDAENTAVSGWLNGWGFVAIFETLSTEIKEDADKSNSDKRDVEEKEIVTQPLFNSYAPPNLSIRTLLTNSGDKKDPWRD